MADWRGREAQAVLIERVVEAGEDAVEVAADQPGGRCDAGQHGVEFAAVAVDDGQSEGAVDAEGDGRRGPLVRHEQGRAVSRLITEVELSQLRVVDGPLAAGRIG